MSKAASANFDYAKTSGLLEIQLRLEFLAQRLDAHLANTVAPRLLEIGIGTGDCTAMLAARGAALTALDRDPGVCQAVAARIREAGLRAPTIICAAVEDYRFEDRCDGIVLQNILEHVGDPVLLLRTLQGALAPTGRFYVNVPLAGSLHRLMGVELGMIERPDTLSENDIAYGHRRVYTSETLLDHIAKAGLRADFEMPYYLKPFSTAMLKGLNKAQHTALFNLGRTLPALASYYYVEAVLQ